MTRRATVTHVGRERDEDPINDELLRQTVSEAVVGLQGPRWPIADAEGNVPSVPGLYAVFGSASAWAELMLVIDEPAKKPLYVGKAEDSFVSRDLRTHFASGRTGQSTVRRSFAALLHDSLRLQAIPRNVANPGHFANFGLSPEEDERLTEWMWRHLFLSVWPTTSLVPLKNIVEQVVRRLDPPLNIEYLPRSARKDLSAARRRMADEARRWVEAAD